MKKQKAYKQDKVRELVYGIHPIIELLKAKKRKIYTIYTTKVVPKAWSQISPLLPSYVQVKYVDKDYLTRLSQTTDHQSVVAYAAPYIFRSKFFDPTKSKFLIMLDSIQDTRNLGAILRSSYCTGVNGIILLSKNAAPLNAVALKSSAGLAEHLEIYQASTAQAAIQELKKAGYNIYLAVLGGNNATKVKYNEPLCLVIGSENIGISKNILNSGEHVTLPQRTIDISYNASVAAGILLFIIANQNNKI